MFRRRREASFRPPASSAWWPAGPDPDGPDPAEGVPALPAGDPFGGWPAFPTDGADPIDPVLGQPDPTTGWGAPAAARPGPASTPPPGSFPAPAHGPFPGPPGGGAPGPGPSGGGAPGPPGGGVPGPPTGGFARSSRGPGHVAPNGRPPTSGRPVPNGTPPAGPPAGTGWTGHPAHTGDQPAVPTGPPAPVAAGPAPGSSHADQGVADPGTAAAGAEGPGAAAADPSQAAPSWLPLLTHADDDQRCQANSEDASGDNDPTGAERTGLRLVGGDEPGRDSRRARNGRRRAGKASRTATDVPEPAASPEAAPLGQPAPAQARDLAFANGATTWLDPVAPINPMEAAALAGAFAADYLSWDEASPNRRGQVLMQYLPSDVVGSTTSAALLGWSGKGRQRAEFSLPGAVHPDGDGRVVVDVRVRVTPYRAVGQPADPAPAGELEVAGVPAVAPAPTARGWKSLDSYWVRMTVPIIRDQGRLVVDTWDEQLNEDDDPVDLDAEHDLDSAGDPAGDVAGSDAGAGRATAAAELSGGGR